ncbi:MAG: YdcF family protein [Dokdonella sp.]
MLNSLISPLRFGFLLGLLTLLIWRWSPRWLRAVLVLGMCICVLLTTPVAANLMIGLQESRNREQTQCSESAPDTIVVVGGGISRAARDAEDAAVLTIASMRRLLGAVDLQRARGASTLVISGGSSRFGSNESELMTALAIRLGVLPATISLEQRSKTTWQNARFVADLKPPIEKRIWLVTSAVHMPRARYAFEQAGFEVCAWPVDPRGAGWGGIGYLLPSLGGLDKAETVLHEWIGEIAYRMGWQRDLDRSPHEGAGEA